MFSFNLEKNFFLTFLKCWPSMDWEPVSCGLCVGGKARSSSRLSEAWAAWPPSIQQTWTPFPIFFSAFSSSRKKNQGRPICIQLFDRSACSGGKFCHCYLHWSHALQTPLMENWNVPSWTERMIYTGIEPLGRVIVMYAYPLQSHYNTNYKSQVHCS